MPDCDDRPTILRTRNSYHFSNADFQNACNTRQAVRCGVVRARCASKNKTYHQDAAGNRLSPFSFCESCAAQQEMILSTNRRELGAPEPDFPIRCKGELFSGPDGAYGRGYLCEECTDYEIEAYWQRRKVHRMKEHTAANTCKCWREWRKRLCYTHREKLMAKIRKASEANCGPDGWLKHIWYDNASNRAVYSKDTAERLRVSHNQGFRDNACRCGKWIPGPMFWGPDDVRDNQRPQPVAMCTACDGVVVSVYHARVENYNQEAKRSAAPAEGAEGRVSRSGSKLSTQAESLNPPNHKPGRNLPEVEFPDY